MNNAVVVPAARAGSGIAGRDGYQPGRVVGSGWIDQVTPPSPGGQEHGCAGARGRADDDLAGPCSYPDRPALSAGAPHRDARYDGRRDLRHVRPEFVEATAADAVRLDVAPSRPRHPDGQGRTPGSRTPAEPRATSVPAGSGSGRPAATSRRGSPTVPPKPNPAVKDPLGFAVRVGAGSCVPAGPIARPIAGPGSPTSSSR